MPGRSLTQLRRVLVTSVALLIAGILCSPSASAATPVVGTVLEVPYGKGAGEVGALSAGELDPSSPPMCPAMFQMTQDGAIWVLDTVNARILEFRDGQQVASIDVSDFSEGPDYFGVTAGAVFVLKQAQRDDMPAGLVLRFDRLTSATATLSLDLPDGRRFLPLGVMPLGTSETQLIVHGSTWPDPHGATVAIGQDGKTVWVEENKTGMPGADGAVWLLKRDGKETDSQLPVFIEKYDMVTEEWRSVASAILPKRPELAGQRGQALLLPLGVDASGVAAVVLFEGSPLSPRVLRISTATGAVQALTLEDLGWDSAPLTRFFASEHYRLLPDGSILAQYATPQRYSIIRLTF